MTTTPDDDQPVTRAELRAVVEQQQKVNDYLMECINYVGASTAYSISGGKTKRPIPPEPPVECGGGTGEA